MKILHTSDWHLGHTIYNYDRTEEQTDMLNQMVEIVNNEKPDLFLLCGDVYHTAQPSASVQTMFVNALMNIHNANPEMTIVITAGNHDSGSRHEIFSAALETMKIYTIGNLTKENFDKHIIEIPNKGYVIAIPYTHERNIPEGFFQQIIDYTIKQNTNNLPIIMSAHTTVKGCDFLGHDHASEYTVGGIDTFDIDQMGEGYDYLALGHIHHEQFVHSGRHNVRYSGSPIQISFDENYPHSISIIEIDKHGDIPNTKKIEINNINPLVTLPTKGFTTWEEAKELLQNFPNDSSAYIRLNIEIEDFIPVDANATAINIANTKQCKFCYINAKRKTQINSEEISTMTIEEFQNESPINIVKRYTKDTNTIFNDEMIELLNAVIEEVSNK
ncbi:MAG: exonuclease SbcCD subunit D [Paludibacteraceae bacterium]|nr:exonuclease SbcCD subunit D [Paludibacteraceae bacterium]